MTAEQPANEPDRRGITPAASWPDALHDLHADAEDRHWWFVARRRIVAAVADRILPPAGATVVDLGCGTGATLASFSAAHERVGYDPAPRAIELARDRFPGPRFEVGAHNTLEDDLLRRADLVLLMDVLEHVQDDARLIASVLHAIRPGAHVLITVPAGPELWSTHDVAVGHRRRYTAASLATLWRPHPVTVRLLSPFNTRLYQMVRIWRWLRRAAKPGHERTDVRLPPALLNALLLRVFAGEAAVLAGTMDGAAAYRRGVSLMAVIQKGARTRDDAPAGAQDAREPDRS